MIHILIDWPGISLTNADPPQLAEAADPVNIVGTPSEETLCFLFSIEP